MPQSHSHTSQQAGGDTAIDPICGMTVNKSTPIRAERDGETFYFCCAGCRQKFLAPGEQASSVEGLPLLDIGGAPSHHGHHSADVVPPSTAKYYCPMCEGIESDKP